MNNKKSNISIKIISIFVIFFAVLCFKASESFAANNDILPKGYYDLNDLISRGIIIVTPFKRGEIPTYTYTGTPVKPKVTLKIKNGDVLSSDWYDVSYVRNNYINGNACVIITGKYKLYGVEIYRFKIRGQIKSLSFNTNIVRLYKGYQTTISYKANTALIGDEPIKQYDDKSVANITKINNNLTIKATKVGHTKVGVATGGKAAYCDIYVREAPTAMGLTAKTLYMYPGETRTIEYRGYKNGKMIPVFGNEPFTLYDQNIAKSSRSGLTMTITAKNPGKTVVAAAPFGGVCKQALCNIVVLNKPSGIQLIAKEGSKDNNGIRRAIVGNRTYKIYNQNMYGSNISAGGCSVTSMAIVLSGYGKNMSPSTIANAKGVTLGLKSISNGLKGYNINNSYTSISATQAQNKNSRSIAKNLIQNNLKQGKPVIMLLMEGRDNAYTRDAHYVVLVGFDKNGNPAIANPNGGLYQNKHSLDTLINNYMYYYGTYGTGERGYVLIK